MSFILSPGIIVPPLTAGGVAYGNGSQAKVSAAGTAGQVLTSAGAGAPVFAAASGGVTPPLTAGGVAYGTGSQVKVSAAGTAGQVLTSAGAGVPVFAAGGYTLGTSVPTTSGTAIDFSGLPAGVKQIIVNFQNVSSNSVGNFSITLGTSSGLTTGGYSSNAITVSANASVLSAGDTSFSLFVLTGQKPAANNYSGSIFCTLENSVSNTWALSGILGAGPGASTNVSNVSAGSVSLNGSITQLRIQALGDTFDDGEVNIAYM